MPHSYICFSRARRSMHWRMHSTDSNRYIIYTLKMIWICCYWVFGRTYGHNKSCMDHPQIPLGLILHQAVRSSDQAVLGWSLKSWKNPKRHTGVARSPKEPKAPKDDLKHQWNSQSSYLGVMQSMLLPGKQVTWVHLRSTKLLTVPIDLCFFCIRRCCDPNDTQDCVWIRFWL